MAEINKRLVNQSLAGVISRIENDIADIKRKFSATPPSGAIVQFAGASSPTGYLICDGSLLTRADYPRLFAAIGTQYNIGGETSAQFRIPDLKGRVPVGRNSSDTDFDTLGEKVGNKTELLDLTHIPSHSHDDGTLTAASSGSHNHTTYANQATNTTATAGQNRLTTLGGPASNNTGSTSTDGAHTHDITGSTGLTGGGQPHKNIQPSIVLNYIIKT